MQVQKAGPKKTFDKYALYMHSVQSADGDVVFFRKVYRELRGKDPITLREDFCGTFALCCEWAKLNKKHKAVGLDLDPEPLQYGRDHVLTELSPMQAKRVQVYEMNVLESGAPKADITVALNFSYFLFKTRILLREYFRQSFKNLKPGGIFMVDVFGGSACGHENEEKTNQGKFTYFWHQHGFDPVTARAKFSIHFQMRGERKVEDVFTYDWRMWTIPEIREVMLEAGFKRTHVYWEGTNKKGGGNGVFTRTEKGEECEAWIAYIVGER